jgi:hypothetical protein
MILLLGWRKHELNKFYRKHIPCIYGRKEKGGAKELLCFVKKREEGTQHIS